MAKPNKNEDKAVEPEKAAEAVGSEAIIATPAPAVREEASWDLATWAEVVRLRIGVAPHVLVGAMCDQDQAGVYTERQVRALVEDFLTRPVQKR